MQTRIAFERLQNIQYCQVQYLRKVCIYARNYTFIPIVSECKFEECKLYSSCYKIDSQLL